MTNEALTNLALLYSMAALSGEGDASANNSYVYAVKAGFKGSEEKFQELWLASLNSGDTNSILDGGESDSSEFNVQNDGGEGDSKTYHLRVDGINELDD